MRWNDKEIKTMGDVMGVVDDIMTNSVSPEADAYVFMEMYREENVYADENIGYLTGYYNHPMSQRIRDVFRVEHPFFGVEDPTWEQAFEFGKTIGKTGWNFRWESALDKFKIA